jgi:hypothetical protein
VAECSSGVAEIKLVCDSATWRRRAVRRSLTPELRGEKKNWVKSRLQLLTLIYPIRSDAKVTAESPHPVL